jgi:hypothetical protein
MTAGAMARFDALSEAEVLGKVIGDIVREGIGREGGDRRRNLDETAEPLLRQLTGDDYATVPFPMAFKGLARTREGRPLSRTALARKTTLSKTQVHRLLTGAITPSTTDMELVAATFGKHPAFFIEYRNWLIISYISQHLQCSPETSWLWVNKLRLGA